MNLPTPPNGATIEAAFKADPGHTAVYLRSRTATGSPEYSLYPVILWVVVRDDQGQIIRPYTHRLDGAVVDVEDIGMPLVCVVTPNEDAIKTADAVIAVTEGLPESVGLPS